MSDSQFFTILVCLFIIYLKLCAIQENEKLGLKEIILGLIGAAVASIALKFIFSFIPSF